jgi:2'-5' RNA ligase
MTAVATAPSRTQNKKFDYGCLMGMLPESLSAEIIRWTKENIDPSHLGTGGFTDYPHITVKYGFTSPYKTIRDQIRQISMLYGPLTVRLGGFSLFRGNEDGDVLKVDVESEDLHQLNRVLSEQFDTEDKYPTYKPHLTIAYLDPNFSSAYTANLAPFLNQEVLITELDYSCQTGKRESITLVFPGLGSKGVKASYFAECERDDEGHCLPKGEAGQETSEEDKPSNEEVSSESEDVDEGYQQWEKDHDEWTAREEVRSEKRNNLDLIEETDFGELADYHDIDDDPEKSISEAKLVLDSFREKAEEIINSIIGMGIELDEEEPKEYLLADVEEHQKDIDGLLNKAEKLLPKLNKKKIEFESLDEEFETLTNQLSELEESEPEEPDPDFDADIPEPDPEDFLPDEPVWEEYEYIINNVYGDMFGEAIDGPNATQEKIDQAFQRKEELDEEAREQYDLDLEIYDKERKEAIAEYNEAHADWEKEYTELKTQYDKDLADWERDYPKWEKDIDTVREKIDKFDERRAKTEDDYDELLAEMSDIGHDLQVNFDEVMDGIHDRLGEVVQESRDFLDTEEEEDPEPDMDDYDEEESEDEEDGSEEVEEEATEEEVEEDDDISFNLDDYDDKSFRTKGSAQGQPCGRGQNPERDGCIPKEQSGSGESNPSESQSEESQEAPSQPSTPPDDQLWLHTNKEGEVTMVSLPGEDGNREYVTRGQTHFIKTLGDSLQQRIQQIAEDGKVKMMDFYHRFFDSLDPDAEDEYLGSDEETVREFETEIDVLTGDIWEDVEKRVRLLGDQTKRSILESFGDFPQIMDKLDMEGLDRTIEET